MKLVLSPHPDDAEYSMSGKVLKNHQEDWMIVTCSSGGNNDHTTNFNRAMEVDDFWFDLPHVSLEILEFDKTIAELHEWEIVAQLDDIIYTYDIDTVYAPSLDDNHFEHRKVSNAARASIRNKAISLIEYQSPSTRQPLWTPNLFVELSPAIYQEKCNRLRAFESQKERKYFNEKSVKIFHEDYFCRLREVELVEKFKIIYKFER